MYALLAATTLATLFWSPPDPSFIEDEWVLTAGRNVHHRADFGHRGLVTLEYRPYRPIGMMRGLSPTFGLGLSPDRTRYAFAGVHKDVHLGQFVVTPSFSPTLFQPHGEDDRHALLQFRTSVEVHALAVGQLRMGVGYSHISNGTLTSRNAGIDAFSLTLRGRF
jgi:hypothetical protein